MASDFDPEHLPGQFAHVDVPVVQAEADGRRDEALQQRLEYVAVQAEGEHLAAWSLAALACERGHVERPGVHRDTHQVGVWAELAERLREALAVRRHGPVALREAVVVASVHVQHEVRRVLGARVLAKVSDERRVRAWLEGKLPRLPHALREDVQILAVGVERQDVVEVRRRTGRAVVVAVGEADVHADIQAAVGAEADAVESIELLPGHEQRLADSERPAIPAAPRDQPPARAAVGEHRAADVQLVVVPGQAGHELERATYLDRGAVLQHVDPAVRWRRALGVATIADEHPAVTESERRRRLQPGRDELNFVTISRDGRRRPGTRAGGWHPQSQGQGGGQASHRDYWFEHDYSPDLNEGPPLRTGDG